MINAQQLNQPDCQYMGDSRKGLYWFQRRVAAGYHEPLGFQNDLNHENKNYVH